MSNTDIQALLNGSAAIQTKIEILPQVAGESSIILTESNGVVSWDYEDFRFIKDQGFIGQFIAKQVTGTIKNPSDNFSMTDREFKLQMGIKVGNTLTWYSLGNFLVTKVTDDEVKDTTKFEALDYAKKFNKRYEDTITYPCTMLELVQNICNQCGCELGSTNFKHKDWVIDGNYFQNNESCRDVMKNLGKLAYSWVRVDWDNKVYFDFTKKTTVDSYNKITNHEYYSLTTQKEKKIVNRVVIGYSNIDGEQTKVEDTASIKANGLCEITIFDNPLVYSQALREKAIVGASDLLGLEYTPLEMQTVGHPWLKGYELIEATDMEGKVYKTIPFNRTIQYFGHIKSLIKIETETKTNTEYAYESGLKNDFLNAQIQVNKKLGTITSTVDEMNTKVEDITTTTQTSTGGNSLYLKEALESNALEYSIDGKCEQETRSGKNLANIKAGTYSLNGITLTINNGEILLNGTATAATTFTGIGEFLYKTGKNYSGTFIYESGSCTDYGAGLYLSNSSTSNVNIGGGAGFRQNQSRTFNITSKTEDIQEYFYIVVNKNTVINNYRVKIQIVEGTTADYNFEQYGASPSPDYPSEIKTIKGIRNLFDYKNASILNAYIGTADNKTIITAHDYNRMTYLHIKPNTTYTVSKLISQQFSLGYCTEEPVVGVVCRGVIDGTKIAYDGVTRHSLSIETDDNANYLVIRYINTANEPDVDLETILKSIQIEEGSIAHSYVPYGAWAKVKVTGKNLFTLGNEMSSRIGISVEYNYNELTFNGTTTNSGTIFKNNDNIKYDGYRKIGKFKAGKYIFKSLLKSGSFTIPSGAFATYLRKADNSVIMSYASSLNNTQTFRLTGETDLYLQMYVNKANIIFNNCVVQIYIEEVKEEQTEPTEYEPYKEKEVLIDLAKENLLETPYTESNKLTATATKNDYYAAIDYYAELEAGKTYTFSCKTDGTFGTNNQQTECYLLFDKKYDYIIHMDDKNCFKFAPTQTGKYYVRYDVNVKGETHSFWDFAIYKGRNADDSYELNSIGDIKDKLEIINGVANIQKRIGKVVLDGINYKAISKSGNINNMFNITNIENIKKPNSNDDKISIISTHFKNDYSANELYNNKNLIGIAGKTDNRIAIAFGINSKITTNEQANIWLQSNPVPVYYELNEPETITLPNTNIPLYEGINHVTLVEDLETTTSIKYLRKTPISGEYALNQDLNKTNSNLADTNNQLSQTQSDIDNTKTNLNNNYYNKEQVDSINSTTTQNITQIRNTMEQNITSTNASISKIQEEITNGVSKVTTTTGTFDENGLNISKSGQQMSSTLDWDGLEVVRDKGKATETEVLTVRSAGVEAENMTVRNFFIKKPIRIEKCKSITDSTKVGLGFFWIGE